MEILRRPPEERLSASPPTGSRVTDLESQTPCLPKSSPVPKHTFTFVDRLKIKLSNLPPTPVLIVRHENSDAVQTAQSGTIENTTTDTSEVSTILTSTHSFNTESTTTSTTKATSILIVPSVFTFDQVHVAPLMPIDEHTKVVWEKSIRVKLRTILYHEISAGSCSQELTMAGRKRDALKPTIVVTCGDLQMRKNVERVFNSPVLTWLRHLLKSNGINFVACVRHVSLSSLSTGATIGVAIGLGVGLGIPIVGALALCIFRSPMWQRRAYAVPPLQHNHDEMSEYGQSSHFRVMRISELGTRHGMQATASHAPYKHQPCRMPAYTNQMEMATNDHAELPDPLAYHILHGESDVRSCCGQVLQVKDRICTMGGLVVVGGKLYGLSVSHAFAVEEMSLQENGSNSVLSLGNEDASHGETNPFWYDSDEDVVSSDSDDSTISGDRMPVGDDRNGSPNEDSQQYSTPLQDDLKHLAGSTSETSRLKIVDYSNTTDSSNARTEDPISDNDWVLLSLDETPDLCRRPNILMRPEDQQSTEITTYADTLFEGPVHIVYKNQAILGTVRSLLSTIQVERDTYDVQMILMDQILPMGCSGSWVVADNMLCGHIISASQDVPFAYMIPIHSIFEDIKKRRNTTDVRLPTRADHEVF